MAIRSAAFWLAFNAVFPLIPELYLGNPILSLV